MTDQERDFLKWLKRWIRVGGGCPKCGANLFTQADYDLVKLMLATADYANTVIGEVPDDSKMGCLRIEMDGSGIPKVGEIEA